MMRPCAGLKYKDVTMGLLGDYGIFSMNFKKTITSVLEGGIIFSNDAEYEFFKFKMKLYDIKEPKGVLKKAVVATLSRILYKSNLYYYLRKLRKAQK